MDCPECDKIMETYYYSNGGDEVEAGYLCDKVFGGCGREVDPQELSSYYEPEYVGGE